MDKSKLGLIHIYTGDGKGKTTAALGLILRASGRGLHVVLGQFLKGRETGELHTLSLLPGVTVFRGKPLTKFGTSGSSDDRTQPVAGAAGTGRLCFRDLQTQASL